MFKTGMFSSDKSQPHQVDSEGLAGLTVGTMREGLQVTDKNPIAGLEGRTELLIKLSEAMKNHTYFGADGRPGNMLGMFTIDVNESYTNNWKTILSNTPQPKPPQSPSLSSPPSGKS